MAASKYRILTPVLVAAAVVCGSLISSAAAVDDSSSRDGCCWVSVCPRRSLADSISKGIQDRNFLLLARAQPPASSPPVVEGDELSLQRALHMVHMNGHAYVAVLFYASWCPFSRAFRPIFSLLSSLYPGIPHLAVEESSIKPSILSKYGVHGFPTLFLLNSTLRLQYHGPRTLGSLVAFYSDVTGIKTASLDKGSLERIGRPLNHEKQDSTEQENCPFSWARSPEHMFRQETYLALATAFVLLRLLYIFMPTVLEYAQFAWRMHFQNMRLRSLLDLTRAYLNGTIQLFNSLKQPCRKSNLQEGALNAKAWASKSLATVSIGDAGTSRGSPAVECH